MNAFPAIFRRQLRYWTFHCCLNALPSFCLAIPILELWKSPVGIAAMLAAIATFILLYGSLTSVGPFVNDGHPLSRALHTGTRMRGWMSAVSITVLPFGGMALVPDFWCGYFSAQIVSWSMGASADFTSFQALAGIKGGFLDIYLTTMLEGLILSGLLLFISFIAVLFIQSRDRRKFFQTAPLR